jgi:hypothetical protein
MTVCGNGAVGGILMGLLVDGCSERCRHDGGNEKCAAVERGGGADRGVRARRRAPRRAAEGGLRQARHHG